MKSDIVVLLGGLFLAAVLVLLPTPARAADFSLRTRPDTQGDVGVRAGAPPPMGLTVRVPAASAPETTRRRAATWLDVVVSPEKDVGLFLAAQASLLLDMGQTLDIARRPGLFESNPILGPTPHADRVGLYFGAWVAATSLAWWALPDRWANALSRVILTVQLPVLDSNASAGLTIRF